MKTTLYIFLGILFLFTVWQFYGSYNNKQYETISNEIIGSINSIDFKIYDQYTKASVNTKAYNMKSASGNFPVLANYIFGGNKDNIQMEMTSPVLYNMSNKSSFSFVMPKEFSSDESPPVFIATEVHTRARILLKKSVKIISYKNPSIFITKSR